MVGDEKRAASIKLAARRVYINAACWLKVIFEQHQAVTDDGRQGASA